MTVKEQLENDPEVEKCKKSGNHKIKHEFREGKFPRGWRGDYWCKNCPYAVFSREARRMEMFGLIKNVNPPTMKGLKSGTVDGDMFRVGRIKI